MEVDAEASLWIPDVDRDVGNKLYLYSLMRNKEGYHSLPPTSSTPNDLSSLRSHNSELKDLNSTKRKRVAELRNRLRSLTQR